jgi:N-acetylmuramoyl-L-alanine amidase
MKKLFLLLMTLLLSSSLFAQRANLSGLKFCIDPGHGGHNGANDRHVIPDVDTDFWESESNFQKALRLEAMLKAQGASVLLTRYTNDYPTDAEPSLSARVALANENNVNWFHSIHSNATGWTSNTTVNSSLMLVREKRSTTDPAASSGNGMGIPERTESLTMANLIGPSLVAYNRTTGTSTWLDWTFYGGTSGGFSLGVLRGLLMPGELSEGSFHDNYPETRRLMNNSYCKMEAYALYNSFLQYYNVPLDTLGKVAGIQKNTSTGSPINGLVVRLLPSNRIYNGDNYNNGYFLFDSLAPGTYTIRFETPGYTLDSVSITIPRAKYVLSSTPLNGAVGVDRGTSMTITFLNPMDTAAVRASFSLTPSVEGTLAWNSARTVLTFQPKNILPHRTTYTVKVNGYGDTPAPTYFVDNKAITSTSTVIQAYAYTFTTIPLSPTVTLTQPANGDTAFSVTRDIGIRFSDPMDTASVRNAFSITPQVIGSINWQNVSTTTTILFHPTLALSYNTNYTVIIDGTAKSILGFFVDGNKDSVGGDPILLSFRTAKDPNASVLHDGTVPVEFSLEQNYPNPFNPATMIRFAVPRESNVEIMLYDVLGKSVSEIVKNRFLPGIHQIQFDASSLPSGVYFCRMIAGEYSSIIKLIVQK